MRFLYDAISFLIRPTADKAFGLIADVSEQLNNKQLRDTADYLNSLKELREWKSKNA